MIKGFDTNTPTTAHVHAIKAAGYEFVARYYKVTRGSRPLTKEEAIALTKAGLYIVTVWENGYPVSADYFSREKGQEDGQHALECAQKVGQPAGTPIYFAVDYDASEADVEARIKPYFEGVRFVVNGHYPAGVYGSGLVCAHLKTAGLASHVWLAQARGWAGFRACADWNILQGESVTRFGLDIDLDESRGDGGGWQVKE